MFIEKIVIKQQQKFFEYMINEIANIKDIDLNREKYDFIKKDLCLQIKDKVKNEINIS